MKLMFDMLHPAHVHFFRPFIAEMTARGHETLIASRRKDVTVDLLDAYGLPHVMLSTQRKGAVKLGLEMCVRTAGFVALARRFKPDYLLGIMGPVIAVAGRVLPARSVAFYDNETADRINRAVVRACHAWWSPRGFALDYGPKHRRYDGYHELAYLHPNRFTPDPAAIAGYGLLPDQPYFVLRFVSWESVHDFGESGFSLAGKRRLIEMLKPHGKVLITSEAPLPAEFEAHRLAVPVEHIHHVLAYARLLVGESSTMASEAACLGTHALFVSRSGRGVNDEQEARYGLVHNFTGGAEDRALERVADLLARDDLKADAAARRERLLAETIDVTAFLVEYFESGLQDTRRAKAAGGEGG